MNSINLINSLNKFKKKRPNDIASRLLHEYCEGANSFFYRLDGHNFDKTINQIGKNNEIVNQHDTKIIEYLTQEFFKVDSDNFDLLVLKDERFYTLDTSFYRNSSREPFQKRCSELKPNFKNNLIYHINLNQYFLE